ncbi:MAG TPA: hypothetical protein VJU18_03660, partial [Vicinamibacteria bacterium]|nr:hypothetical protein [Vicinamibacteria bacterium]
MKQPAIIQRGALMESLQVGIINLYIVALWALVIPCLSVSVHLRFSGTGQAPGGKRSIKHVLPSLILLGAIAYLTVSVQDINPICSGAGDGYFVCAGHKDAVSFDAARIITTTKMLSDMARTIGIP